MKFFIVDVFAEEKYQGNQLAVLLPDREISTSEMQKIAREINFSEITYIMSGKRENGGYDVRYFTPDVEIPFAGHPTLGTAYIIRQILEKGESGKVILNLPVGQIPVAFDSDVLTMEQNEPEFGLIVEDRGSIADILKISAGDIREDYPIQVASTGLPSLIVPLKSLDAVKACAVNHGLYQGFIDNVFKCNLLVFAPEGEGHVRVRVFVDDPGFVEDPATGSANGNLAGYFLKYNFFGSNKIRYNVNQGEQIGRPSLLRIAAELTGETYDIKVGGKVFLVAEGNWL